MWWELSRRAGTVEPRRLRPDVVVLDIGMPKLNGLSAGQRLKQRCRRRGSSTSP